MYRQSNTRRALQTQKRMSMGTRMAIIMSAALHFQPFSDSYVGVPAISNHRKASQR
jgi:urease beta subunit